MYLIHAAINVKICFKIMGMIHERMYQMGPSVNLRRKDVENKGCGSGAGLGVIPLKIHFCLPVNYIPTPDLPEYLIQRKGFKGAFKLLSMLLFNILLYKVEEVSFKINYN